MDSVLLIGCSDKRLLKKRCPEADRSADASAYNRGWGLIEAISAVSISSRLVFAMSILEVETV